MPMTEEELEGVWAVDPIQRTRIVLLQYHFDIHGSEVDAVDIQQYLHKATAFAVTAKHKNGRGRSVEGKTPGVRRWEKLGKYVDITSDGEIVSFGRINR